MSNKNNSSHATYHLKSTQSIFLVAGTIMISTFPYLIKYFNTSGLLFMFLIVAVAIMAGLATSKSYVVLRLNVVVAIIGFVLSAYRSVNIFFNGVEEPIEIFAFWSHQILALVFFFSIYFALKSIRS